MVDTVALVRGLCDGILYGSEGWVTDWLPNAVVYEIVTSIAYRNCWWQWRCWTFGYQRIQAKMFSKFR